VSARAETGKVHCISGRAASSLSPHAVRITTTTGEVKLMCGEAEPTPNEAEAELVR
jgi:hypothetical protein